MGRVYVFAAVAIVVSLWLSFSWEPGAIQEKVARFEIQDRLPDLAEGLASESFEVQSVFLSYADDRLLLIKAEAALLKYPRLARRILPIYGVEPEFQEILRDYGEAVLLPIDYFMENRIWSLEARGYAAQKYDDLSKAARKLWGAEASSATAAVESPPPAGDSASPEESATSTANNAVEPASDGLSASERGWYAVNFIQQDGPRFLGQFVVDHSGRTHWIQTDRLVGNIGSFLTSGIRTIETKSRTGEEIEAADVTWAAIDALVIFGAAKVARLGKSGAATRSAAAGASRSGAASSRAALLGGRGGKWARYAKWPVIAGATYTIIAHPSLISDLLAGLAKALSLPVWLVQTVGWTLIIFPLLIVGAWLMQLLVRPTIKVLALAIRGLAWGDSKLRAHRYTQ